MDLIRFNNILRNICRNTQEFLPFLSKHKPKAQVLGLFLLLLLQQLNILWLPVAAVVLLEILAKLVTVEAEQADTKQQQVYQFQQE
jgi:hypothetical protein